MGFSGLGLCGCMGLSCLGGCLICKHGIYRSKDILLSKQANIICSGQISCLGAVRKSVLTFGACMLDFRFLGPRDWFEVGEVGSYELTD